MRLGFIGCGGIANAHMSDVLKLKEKGVEVEVTVLVDINLENARKFREKWKLGNVKIVDDYRKIVNDVDSVIICTPHAFHYEQALFFLENGKHVLVEKPMVCKIEEAVKLMEVAKENNLILEVAFQRHFKPKFIRVREFIREGGLGEVKAILLELYQDWYQHFKNTWRTKRNISCGGELLDSGSHIIDIAFWTTGLKPLEVFALMDFYDTEVDINSSVSGRLSNNALLSYLVVGSSPGFGEREVFYGTKGKLEIYGEKLVFYDFENKEHVLDYSTLKSSRPLFNFVDAINGRDENKSPPINGLYVAAFYEVAYKSYLERRPVTIEELFEEKGINYKKYF